LTLDPQSPSAKPAEAALGTVLLVEDDPLIRTVTAMQLKDLGYDVLEAPGASQALDLLRGSAVVALMTDIQLPDMPGTELALQATALRPGLAVVFASGRRGAEAAGPPQAVFLPKPYTKARLREALAGACAAASGGA
jgi:CheY-like chemotaxis protein